MKENNMKPKSLFLRVALGISVLLLAAFSTLPLIPPRDVPAEAPSTRFSAERAMTDLAVIAKEPHGAGSDAQARVREYILGEVEILGLNSDIQTSGQLSNILVRLPGTSSTGTVLITGHYDSHPPAPGAGDNGISVAAMLEAIRVLHANPPLYNDVLFLFTDGEEMGWKGAIAFINEYPDTKKEIDAVLVFEARPGNAPLTLLETSPGDAWLIRQMTGIPLTIWAGSWNNREERNEQDTDFDVFQVAGFTGAAFENEANGIRYHNSRDTVDAISPSLVQAYGETILCLADRFGTVDLSSRVEGPDLTFFSLPIVGVVAYPGWIMPVLVGLGIITLLCFLIVSRRNALFSLGHFLLGMLGLMMGIVLIVGCAHLAWGVILKRYISDVITFGGFGSSAAWMSGVMVGASLLMIVILAVLSRRLGSINLSIAAVALYLFVWFIFHFLMEADDPLTTPYVAFPFLGCVAGMGGLLFAKKPIWMAVFLAAAAYLSLVLLVPQLWLSTYTREDAWIPILVVCLSLGNVVPQVGFIFERGSSKENHIRA